MYRLKFQKDKFNFELVMHVFRTILYFTCLLKSIAGKKIREKLSKCMKIKPIIILKYVCYTKNKNIHIFYIFKLWI